MKKVFIIKASGQKVAFSEEKYRQSLHRSGASKAVIDDALKYIIPLLFDGISTKKLYSLTNRFLKRGKKHAVAGRYNLKNAIMELGPSGFPFEKYVGVLFQRRGYSVVTDQKMQGKCALHEVDLVAQKGNERIVGECKFHGRAGLKCALQTVLYVYARHQDIQEYVQEQKHKSTKVNVCYLITNTKITSVGIHYGECRGINMIAWRYPRNNGLERMVDDMGLHPVTCLSTVTKKIKQIFLQKEIILCRQVKDNVVLLKRLQLSKRKIDEVLQECKAICTGV